MGAPKTTGEEEEDCQGSSDKIGCGFFNSLVTINADHLIVSYLDWESLLSLRACGSKPGKITVDETLQQHSTTFMAALFRQNDGDDEEELYFVTSAIEDYHRFQAILRKGWRSDFSTFQGVSGTAVRSTHHICLEQMDSDLLEVELVETAEAKYSSNVRYQDSDTDGTILRNEWDPEWVEIDFLSGTTAGNANSSSSLSSLELNKMTTAWNGVMQSFKGLGGRYNGRGRRNREESSYVAFADKLLLLKQAAFCFLIGNYSPTTVAIVKQGESPDEFSYSTLKMVVVQLTDPGVGNNFELVLKHEDSVR